MSSSMRSLISLETPHTLIELSDLGTHTTGLAQLLQDTGYNISDYTIRSYSFSTCSASEYGTDLSFMKAVTSKMLGKIMCKLNRSLALNGDS